MTVNMERSGFSVRKRSAKQKGSWISLLFLEGRKPEIQDGLQCKNQEELLKEKEMLAMPADGMIKPLSEAADEAFANEALGKGCLVIPENGNVYAPFDGTVRVLFPTKHAIGLASEGGCEALIHIGINTVNLDGKYFETHVQQGDCVKKGQLLVSFEKEKIEQEGYSCEIPVIITNTDEYLDIVEKDHDRHVHGEDMLHVIR